jgi:hypothetical protein
LIKSTKNDQEVTIFVAALKKRGCFGALAFDEAYRAGR